MTPEDRRFELEMKADRILYRLSTEQMAYLGDGFPWPIDDADLSDGELLDEIRQAALSIGYRAAMLASGQLDSSLAAG